MDEQIPTSRYFSTSNLTYDGMKRIFDVVVGLVLLTILSPIFIVTALAVRLSSKGSIFYKQERVGRCHRLFFVWKFRTMYSDADRNGPLITSSDDDRITAIGKYLRKNKIDELPQLWNVIVGDMSLVGPRPQVPRFVNAFPSDQRAIIMSVRPGITGPTQLKFRDEEKMLEGQIDREGYYIEHLLPIKCQMDVDYVQHRSFISDLRVLFKTGWIITLSLIRRALGRNNPPRTEIEEAVVFETYRLYYSRQENRREEVEEVETV